MKIYNRAIWVVLVITFAFSCHTADTLTEDEILAFDKQDWQYAFTVLDPYTLQPISDVNLTTTLGGEVISVITNASGAAEFKSGFVSGFDLLMSKPGYFATTEEIDFSETGSGRSKLLAMTLYLFPDADYGTFTIQGKATVQSDLTTLSREIAPGARFTIEVGVGNSTLIFLVTTDNSGNYKIKIPAQPASGYFVIHYEGYVVQQKIAVNRLNDQPAFPATLPSIMQIATSFDPINPNISVPTVLPVFATVGATPTGGGALAANLAIDGNINASGEITFININSAGFGYAASSINLPVTITSLETGSGAVITANTNASGQVTSINLTNGGSGYSPFNANTNKVGAQGFTADIDDDDYTSPSNPGVIIINNIYYGTGTSREKVIN